MIYLITVKVIIVVTVERTISDYSKIQKISPGAYIFQGPFLRGLIFGGAYIRRGLSTEGQLRFKIDWASLIVGMKANSYNRINWS